MTLRDLSCPQRESLNDRFNSLELRVPRAEEIAFAFVLLFGFFICLSTALMNIFLALALVFTLFSGRLRRYAHVSVRNPVCLAAILLFLLLAAGTIWSVAEGGNPYRVLNKYNELWYVSLLLPLFSSVRRQRFAINAFLLSTSIVLVLVYAIHLNVIPEFNIPKGNNQILHVTARDPFGNDILVNILMSYAMFIFANRALTAERAGKIAYAVLSLLAAYYTIFISSGTTGQITSLCLLVLFLVQILGWKSILPVVFVLASILVYGYAGERTSLRYGVTKIVDGVELYYGEGDPQPDSVALRLEFAHNSITLFKENPWIGTGTGSIGLVYGGLPPEEVSLGPTDNPHNEYLAIAIQLGVLGLFGLLALFAIQWTSTLRVVDFEHRRLAQGLVVLIVVACMGNSMIMDSGEGHFWAYFSAALFAGVRTRVKPNAPANDRRRIPLLWSRARWSVLRTAGPWKARN